MKTLRIGGFLLLLFAAACNGSGEGNGDEDTTATTIGPVENVNGNMPDTSNTIDLGDDTANTTIDTTPH